VYGGKDLLKIEVLSSEWNTERVREDASGDSEDGEDDELPCVIGESAGDRVWRGSRRSVDSSFHRQGAAYPKELLPSAVTRWASRPVLLLVEDHIVALGSAMSTIFSTRHSAPQGTPSATAAAAASTTADAAAAQTSVTDEWGRPRTYRIGRPMAYE